MDNHWAFEAGSMVGKQTILKKIIEILVMKGFSVKKVYKVDGRHPEPDATGMEEDLPSAAEDCAKQRGSYEI